MGLVEYIKEQAERILTAQGDLRKFAERRFAERLERALSSDLYHHLMAEAHLQISSTQNGKEEDREFHIEASFSVEGKNWVISQPFGDRRRWIILGPDRTQAFYYYGEEDSEVSNELVLWIYQRLQKA